jgi:dipeptidase E
VKLFLSSFRLGDEPTGLVRLAGGPTQVAVIPNALDAEPASTRAAVIDRSRTDLEAVGFDVAVVDLRDHFDRSRSIGGLLAAYPVLFVTGGNVFVLRRAMQQSSMDEYLATLGPESEQTYAGYSAGACVAGPTLRGLELVDDPQTVPDGYMHATIWDGLGLVEYTIIPHYRSDHHESAAIEFVVERMRQQGHPFRTLRDGEVIVRS